MRIITPGLGGRLRRARIELGHSQEAAAKQIGVSSITVHHYEASQRSVPNHLLDRLSELFNRPLFWFLTLEEGDLGEPTGEVKLASPDPRAQLYLDYRYLEDTWDRQRMREALRLCVRLLEANSYQDTVAMRLSPTDEELATDETLDRR